MLIEVPGEAAGLSLIDHLPGLHAEVDPVADGRCRVRVELDGHARASDVQRRVERWLSCVGVRTTRARLGSREIALTAR